METVTVLPFPVGLKVLSALIDIANDVNHVLDNTQVSSLKHWSRFNMFLNVWQRQVEAERKRQLARRTEAGQAQLEKLVAKRAALQRNNC